MEEEFLGPVTGKGLKCGVKFFTLNKQNNKTCFDGRKNYGQKRLIFFVCMMMCIALKVHASHR